MELPLVVGITGASGAIYGIRMLEVLRHSGIPAHLIVSRSAVQTLSEEIDMPVDKARALADVVYPNSDLGAAVSSGSFKTRGMIVIPCSIRTVSDVAYGHTDTLVSRAADVTLANVKAGPEAVLGQAGGAFPVIERVADEAMAALCAEAVGAMAAMHELTLEYLRTRKQFGVPIGSFQVLQHRAVDMFVALEQARSMAMLATMMTAEPDARERRKAMSAAKVQIGRSAKYVGQEAIQLHGGIGMTMEYKVGHYFKRVTTIDALFGDADHHLAELARLGGLIAAA